MDGFAGAIPRYPRNSPPGITGIKRFSADGQPATGPVSAAVVHDGMIYAAIGANDGGKSDSMDIADHVKRTMDTLKKVLEAAGGDMGSVEILTVHLATLDFYAAMNRVYNPYFQGLTAPGRAPARCTMAFGQLSNGNLFQISCIAAVVRA